MGSGYGAGLDLSGVKSTRVFIVLIFGAFAILNNCSRLYRPVFLRRSLLLYYEVPANLKKDRIIRENLDKYFFLE